jgi:gliding motility-associated-like protein
LILTDNNGCKDSAAQLIDVQSFYISKIIDTAICAGTSFAGYTSTGVYNDILPSTNGCDTMRTINLTVKPKPFLGKDTVLAICEQSSINLSTLYNTAAYSLVVWNTPNVANAAPGSYTLQVMNAQGCSDTVVALIQSIPIIRTTVQVNLCEGQSYAGYSGTGTYTDVFAAAGGCDSVRTLYLQVSPKYNTVIDTTICAGAAVAGYSISGTYTDQFNSVQGCDSIRTLHLTVLPLPVLNIGVDTTICTGDSILLDAGLFNSYTWKDGSTGRYLIVKKAGRYSVTAVNDCGRYTDDIFVQESPCILQFPTAFSPNRDHNNDVFKALSVRKINNYHLVIYNRWGQKVFETRNVQQGWDGLVNGKPAGTGSFVWYCEYSMTNLAQPSTRKGVVTLLR